MLGAVRALLQRVSEASVSVDGQVVGQIGLGLCALIGVGGEDDEAAADRLALKIWQIRLFPDEAGNMNRSASDLGLSWSSASSLSMRTPPGAGGRRSSGLPLRNWPGAWSSGSWTG